MRSGPDEHTQEPRRIYLVRHGETAWSLSGQHTGRTDIPLTANGIACARKLAPCLAGIRFSRVLTSPRQRARETCAQAGLAAEAIIEPDLAEWDYGDYEGVTSNDIHAARPGWTVFQDGCPGGETPAQVTARADRLIAHLDAVEGSVVLFSHGQFGCALAARWMGLPVAAGAHLACGPASLSLLATGLAHPGVRQIELWNVQPPFMPVAVARPA